MSETGSAQGNSTNANTVIQEAFLSVSAPDGDCVCVCVFFRQCPFHGRIIPRDNDGRPLSEEDRLREEQEERRKREEEPGEE